MKNQHKPYLSLLFAGLITGLTLPLSGCNNAEAVAEEKEAEVMAIPVEVVQVSLGDISSNYVTTTVLEANQEAQVIAKASGILEKLYVEEGQYVEAGQLLAEIEPERFQLSLEKAKAELASIKNELERVNKVHSQQLISSDTFDKLKWSFEVASSNLKLAELDLKETQIVAPISGYIAKRYVKQGNLVEQYERKTLFHIVDHQVLEGTVNLPEQELSKLQVNQQAKLKFTARPDQEVDAYVIRISPIVDANTGTFAITLRVNNEQNHLKAGMFANVKLVYDVHQNTKLVPKKSVVSIDNKHTVYTVTENIVEKVDVAIGYQDEHFIEILSGLNQQQTVVITGQNNLKDQALVQIIESI